MYYFEELKMHSLTRSLLVFTAFGLELNSAVDFHFANNLFARFDVGVLPDLIDQYKNSGSFYIELVLDEPFLTLKAEVIL